MELHLHKYDERDIRQSEISLACRLVYSCCEDEHYVVYLLDDHDDEYHGEMRQAA